MHLLLAQGLYRLGGSADNGVELDPVRIDGLCRSGDPLRLMIVDALNQHHLQPDLSGILPAKVLEALDHLFCKKASCRAVDGHKCLLADGIQ